MFLWIVALISYNRSYFPTYDLSWGFSKRFQIRVFIVFIVHFLSFYSKSHFKNCFCGMVDRRKALSPISSGDHCQESSLSRISYTLRAGFEPAQNLLSGLVEWSCAVVITTTPHRLQSWRSNDSSQWCLFPMAKNL